MAWKIDRDYLESGPDSAVGTSQGTLSGPCYPFRLLDDDMEVYYHGIADKAAAENDCDEGGLYQAERWGEHYAGAIHLQLHVSDAIEHGLWTAALAEKDNQKPSDWVSIFC